jgi:mRNA-degrading endonuclease RelE of RelBE toxin-antitoxin system
VSYTVIIHPEAEKEYLDACNWYEQQTSGLGQRFKAAVFTQLEQINKNPEAYSQKKGRYRESRTEVFPYVIVYTINKDLLYIAAIYHTSRNPVKKYRKPL